MHLSNSTTYETSILQELMQRTYREVQQELGTYAQYRALQVQVKYSRYGSHYSAIAMPDAYRIVLRIPKQGARGRLVAYLMEHELRHMYGGEHGDGSFPWKWPKSFKRWSWADSIVQGLCLRRLVCPVQS